MRRPVRLVPLALAAGLLLGACGDADNDATDPDAAAEPGAEDTEPAEEPAEDEPTAGDEADDGGTADTAAEPEDEGEAAVAVASTDLGDVLVDAEGMTLYLFTPDTDGESTCYDDCAAAWPPLTVDGEPAAGEGVDASLLGTTQRDDGSTQLTYNDRPLYLWQGDEAPGDVTGHTVNDVWFAVSPAGEAADSASESDQDIGY